MKDEKQIELSFIKKLEELKYVYREDIKDKAALEENFRKHFQELNRVRLSDSEFARLKENIITPDVFSAAKILRETMQVSALKKENAKIHCCQSILTGSLKHTNTEKKMTKSTPAEFLWRKSRKMDII